MDRKTLFFIALAITMLYGASFVLFDNPGAYAAIGGVVVALSWIAISVFGRDSTE